MNILEIIIDASDQILGRFSSKIAKKLLNGDKIIVINAESAIITGDPKAIMEKFMARRKRGNPHHGPYYPKTSNGILKRSIRGMLPYKKSKGRNAFKRLIIYSKNPNNLKGERIEKTKEQIECKYINLEDITKKLRGI